MKNEHDYSGKYLCIEDSSVSLEIKGNFEGDPGIFLSTGEYSLIENIYVIQGDKILPGTELKCYNGFIIILEENALILYKTNGDQLHFQKKIQ